ncbi:MAG: 16S rRNA (guanine(966)-N(2))-methyltransferase RsmD [Flavobacteriales bacterium]|nr:16S rRNA (guanine(966)-N(2))-methyltransferase RsmD [Flavobacteriales bacterium]
MRIISGKYKGLTIPMPKGGDIRPTTDRAKESLFNILQNRFEMTNCEVLDLFSGSGNMAFEFASQDCQLVISVEKNRKITLQNIAFSMSKDIDVQFITMNVFSFLKQSKDTFDIIFADPPYHLEKMSELPKLIFRQKLLKKGGLLVIEHHSSFKWNETIPSEQRVYGQSVFSFFEFTEENK